MKLSVPGQRRLIQAIARWLAGYQLPKNDENGPERADGYMICEWCGYYYMDHPQIEFPTFIQLCDGNRWKC